MSKTNRRTETREHPSPRTRRAMHRADRHATRTALRLAAGLSALAALPAVAAAGGSGASSISTMDLAAPVLAKDAARHGWPLRPTRRHTRAVARSAAIAIRRTGCTVTRIRVRPLRSNSAANWRIVTNARGRGAALVAALPVRTDHRRAVLGGRLWHRVPDPSACARNDRRQLGLLPVAPGPCARERPRAARLYRNRDPKGARHDR